MEATLEQAIQLGLLESEFESIKEILGRTPNFTELAMYSVMWSEHCSYKNSIKYIKKLPTKGSRILVAAGEENAGLVDIGDGLGVVFKIESHNSPSAKEPFHGAATGVGGINRDIFTMGARPIAGLNSLRLGDLNKDHTKFLFKGILEGIGFYGNSLGVPNVGGEVYFEDCYQTNPLVNAMSAGIVEVGKTISATSYGEGNPVFIVGAATGKDGIGGASFSSEEISDENELPAVQVGDPYEEKRILEACLDLVGKDWLVGMQDMGAAGITCSTAEMSEKGEYGMDIDLTKVPTRQKDMLAWEMLLSESQERMLIVIKKGYEAELQKVFDKWDVNCTEIGVVTKGGNLRFYHHGKLEAEVPAASLCLGGGAPVYEREYIEPKYFEKIKSFDISKISESSDLKKDAETIISLPNIASKRWVYEQFDSMVGLRNYNIHAPSDASLVRVDGTDKVLAMTVDCNARYVYLDPYKGGMIAVAEASRNIVCSGAESVAISNCLNFGNPYNPELYYQFVYALKGMGEACTKFDTPVTGGNVSFYNQSENGPVYPTPTIAMIGIMDHIDQRMTLDFKEKGHKIFVVGKNTNDLNGSEYLFKLRGVQHSPAPHFDLEEEAEMQNKVLELIRNKAISSAHDISEGGLFTAVMESAMAGNLGFSIKYNDELRKDAYLFGEGQSRVIVSVAPEQEEKFKNLMSDHSYEEIGVVTEGVIKVGEEDWGNLEEWKEKYDTVIEKAMAN